MKRNNSGDVTLERVWKKQKFIQGEIQEIKNTLQELNENQKKIEDAVKPKGGSQPPKKEFKIFETDGDKFEFTGIGRSIFTTIKKDSDRELDKNDLEDILVEHDMTRSDPTILNYLRRIESELKKYFKHAEEDAEVKFIKGRRGGINGGVPSRVKLSYND